MTTTSIMRTPEEFREEEIKRKERLARVAVADALALAKKVLKKEEKVKPRKPNMLSAYAKGLAEIKEKGIKASNSGYIFVCFAITGELLRTKSQAKKRLKKHYYPVVAKSIPKRKKVRSKKTREFMGRTGRAKPPKTALKQYCHEKLGTDEYKDFFVSDEWRYLRYQALKKNGASCQCCGATAGNGVQIHVDHIKPRSRYPELELSLDNLQVLCGDCNLGKGAWDDTDWR